MWFDGEPDGHDTEVNYCMYTNGKHVYGKNSALASQISFTPHPDSASDSDIDFFRRMER